MENRLTSVAGSVAATYKYDHQGRRSSKTVGGATTYLYNGVNLIQEAAVSPADYLFGAGIDEPLAMSRGGQVYYYETDALRSVAAVTNSSAAVQNTYLYDAWGQVKSLTGSLANPFTYTAREIGEAGLNFYRARYYTPGIGRFHSEDRLQYDGLDTNFYRYAGAAPVLFTDPFGLTASGPDVVPLLCAILPMPRPPTDPFFGCKGNCSSPCQNWSVSCDKCGTTAKCGKCCDKWVETSNKAPGCNYGCRVLNETARGACRTGCATDIK